MSLGHPVGVPVGNKRASLRRHVMMLRIDLLFNGGGYSKQDIAKPGLFFATTISCFVRGTPVLCYVTPAQTRRF